MPSRSRPAKTWKCRSRLVANITMRAQLTPAIKSNGCAPGSTPPFSATLWSKRALATTKTLAAFNFPRTLCAPRAAIRCSISISPQSSQTPRSTSLSPRIWLALRRRRQSRSKSWLTVSITSPAGRTTALPLSSAIISCLWKPRSTKSAPLS